MQGNKLYLLYVQPTIDQFSTANQLKMTYALGSLAVYVNVYVIQRWSGKLLLLICMKWNIGLTYVSFQMRKVFVPMSDRDGMIIIT
jgi:uncharacterized membrane protein YesL